MNTPVTFRWFGVAGVAITAQGQTLAIDPFFSRPPFLRFFLGHPTPDPVLDARYLPVCDYVLVSHAHWDHLMDVPSVARNTGAIAFGSPNSCRLLALLGLPPAQIRLLRLGDHLQLGPFRVEVLPAEHGFIPFLPPGPLPHHLRPPLRVRDYRMDSCFGFLVEVDRYRLLLLTGCPRPADVVFLVPALHGAAYYRALFEGVQPAVVIPVHWDNLFRPLTAPLREHVWPTSMNTGQLARFVARFAPGAQFLKPEPFRVYDLAGLLARGPHPE
jgi:L-ascorbate metabolism protein UlaG (beta-lactamase superfamily)